MRSASAAERQRLGALFAELCAIASPSGSEDACRERVQRELRRHEIPVEPPDEAGNLLARVPGPPGAPTVLLCAHLDTVPHDGPIRPVVQDGAWGNSEPGAILGADNKAAVAVLLLVAARAAAEGAGVGLELLFTVGEEEALRGAKAFDVRRLRAARGYVLDHASPLGEIVLASPTYHRIVAELHGRAAHAGIRPEKGRSAILAAAHALDRMELGRLDAETTANAGVIAGGTAANVVPESCRVVLEARSLRAEKVERVVAGIVDALQDGANAHDVDVDVDVECLFRGYRTAPDAPEVRAAEEALAAAGVTPRHIVTGGGSDANALQAAGLPCVNLANGTQRNHQPDESVPVAALEQALDVVLALVGDSPGSGLP